VSLAEEVHRIQLTLHYDGTRFHGWQAQRVGRTVQGDIEAAVERLTGRRRPVVASGRTDTGVHATGQVASVDVPVRWSDAELRKAMNAVLPRDVWVADARLVRPDFHPRYHAIRRTYTYRIGQAPDAWSPFQRPWCWPLLDALDPALLDAAAAELPGERSFRAFAKSGQPHRGDVCRVDEARWTPWELGTSFTITADRYLHHMVRYLVGTMVDVARGRRPAEHVPGLLSGADHLTTSPPAPPEGLFLARVDYTDGAAGPP
jgi:tRNA pseudouridine38-40 synthase